MHDSEGKEIRLGQLLTSSLFVGDKAVPMNWVIGMTDMTITMTHMQAGAMPITIDQATLDNSYWVVAGFIEIKMEKKDGTTKTK